MSGSERLPEGSPKGRGVFHKTGLSDISHQRLHKAIHCLASAQPTNRPPQSSPKIGLREAGRLAKPLRFADANHLPFQGRQSTLNAIWYQDQSAGTEQGGKRRPGKKNQRCNSPHYRMEFTFRNTMSPPSYRAAKSIMPLPLSGALYRSRYKPMLPSTIFWRSSSDRPSSL